MTNNEVRKFLTDRLTFLATEFVGFQTTEGLENLIKETVNETFVAMNKAIGTYNYYHEDYYESYLKQKNLVDSLSGEDCHIMYQNSNINVGIPLSKYCLNMNDTYCKIEAIWNHFILNCYADSVRYILDYCDYEYVGVK